MVTVRLTMLCATAAPGSHDGLFGNGSPGERGRRELAAAKAALPPYSRALRAPSAHCARIAEALAVDATPENVLRDLDYGVWDGRPPEDIAAEDPHGFSTWLTDPDAVPHGGESVGRLCRRTESWLKELPADAGSVLTITEAAVIRAALVHVLSVPVRSFWHLRVPALSTVTLTLRDGLWNARLGQPVAERRPARADDSPPVAVLAMPATRQPLCLAGRP
ncbi:histidine phosphatase family protein [Streptomyces sp. E-15]